MQAEPIEGLLTMKEVSRILGLCEMACYRMAWDGTLPSVKIRRSRRVHPDAVRQLIETGTTEKQAA